MKAQITKYYTAQEVAERLNISKQTLLRYEKKNIFPKPRRHAINHWREYTEENIKKLKYILKRF